MAKRDCYDVLGIPRGASKDAKPNDKENVVDADFEDVKEEDKEKSA